MDLENTDIQFIQGIESAYLKNKMKKMEFNKKNVETMGELGKLEYWIRNGVGGFGSAMHYNGMKSTYEKEYRELLKELDPKRYKRLLKQDKKEKEYIIIQRKKSKKRNIRKLEQLKKIWGADK
ncbi:hypothetical protein KO465_04075 [Candidatus Micrarchaeota archaeon]|nr:hypothetical protein [Candidatus Micrarchaeota archaeon]